MRMRISAGSDLSKTFVFRPIWIFVCSKVLHISLLPHRIQGLSTIDFQGKNHDLTSTGISQEAGKIRPNALRKPGSKPAGNIIPESMIEGKNTSCAVIVSFA